MENKNVDISMVKFDEKGLVPAVVQEENGQVLMLAYMNEESLKKTLETGYTWFFSRSRQKLWQKGETSGNVQKVKEISYDCDGDTLLVIVHQTGVACHTGTYTCFSGRKLAGGEEKGVAVIPEEKKANLATILYDLYNVIQDRRVNPVEGSYTNYLFDKGQDKILKKSAKKPLRRLSPRKTTSARKSSTKWATSGTTASSCSHTTTSPQKNSSPNSWAAAKGQATINSPARQAFVRTFKR